MIIYTWNHERHASTLDSWQIDQNSTRIDISLLSSPQALADSASPCHPSRWRSSPKPPERQMKSSKAKPNSAAPRPRRNGSAQPRIAVETCMSLPMMDMGLWDKACRALFSEGSGSAKPRGPGEAEWSWRMGDTTQ